MKIEVPEKTLKQVTKLDLSDKNLKQFPNEIFLCTNLTKLILANNSISKIPKEISSLRKLKVLDLSNNDIKQIHAEVFKLSKLRTFNVASNNVKTLPKQLKDSSIKELFLQNNNISIIDEKLICNIEKLNISQNKLTEFRIKDLDSKLTSLWISNNPIKVFFIKREMTPSLKRIYAYTDNIGTDCSSEYYELCKNRGNSHDVYFSGIKKNNSINRIEENNSISSVTKEDKPPVVFISYSWDDNEHREWVTNLADRLTKKGVDVIFDCWETGLGDLLPNFMEASIAKSNRVICVMTPNYKKKTERLEGGAGYEYSIIGGEMFSRGTNNTKFIPVLRVGTNQDAIPCVLLGRNYIDMRHDEEFDTKFDDLLRDIHNKPKNKKPPIGEKPNFED